MPRPYAIITPELEAVITQDLFAAYQAQFGERWRSCFTKNLRPSPNKEIAERYNVPMTKVKSIKQKIWSIGMLLQAVEYPTDLLISNAEVALTNSLQAFVDGTPMATINTNIQNTLTAAEPVAEN